MSFTMYGVFDNNKPANSTAFPQLKGKGWKSHLFGTFKDAEEYAKEWLGDYYPGKDVLVLGLPYNYSGYGDLIEIREVPVMQHVNV